VRFGYRLSESYVVSARGAQVTVDGDTSTNDTVLAMASGAAGNAAISDRASAAAQQLQAALTGLLQGMAKAIAWDGEGATCLMEVRATGASCEEDALAVAKSVAASSLTKAAIFGHDPNWGRIACAAGYSGTPVTVCGYCWYCCIENCKPFEVTRMKSVGECVHQRTRVLYL
jgi:N-acetylglutamate synthase/N-acetylornithine aminotransferase